MLQDSLGGCSQTALIVCCSPSADNAAETLSSLRFGARAKGVQNTVQVRQYTSNRVRLSRYIVVAEVQGEGPTGEQNTVQVCVGGCDGVMGGGVAL